MSGDIPIRSYVFGDQTYNVTDVLAQLLQAHDDVVLTDFLERSSGTLKREIACLSREQREQCPRFADIMDLVPYCRAGSLNPALVQGLTCVAQCALFIREHGPNGLDYPLPDGACVNGVCTGALAAVAVSCASSVQTLVPLALHTVAVALRLGAVAWEVASRISNVQRDCNGGSFPSWTHAVAGASLETMEEAVHTFAATRALPSLTSPYISAHVGPTQLSVSGPPATISTFINSLRHLDGSSHSPRITHTPLPITAPYHAKHLYTDSDVDHVLARIPAGHVWPDVRVPIVSYPSGLTFTAALREAVRDCLVRPIPLDYMAASIADHVLSKHKHTVIPHPIALSFADRLGPQINSHLPEGSDASSNVPASTGTAYRVSEYVPAAKSPIAIVAASGRFPQAPNMEAFWDVLTRGIDTHEVVPPTRWSPTAHVGSEPLGKNVSGTGFGCWLHDAGLFDAGFFHMSPREAPQVDPAQRLALLTAAEALEQAGIVPDRTPSTRRNRIGVYFGCTSNDWMETNSAQKIDTYFIPGGNRAFIPGRINYYFKFSGPSYTIDTACSSSLAALHMACNALWRGEIDTAIVGGTNILTNPDMTAGLDRGHFLSRTGNCKTFDDNADGYCRGEAVVTLILKRSEDAQLDKDPIQANILGIATNHSAEAESITRPHVGAQKELFERVLAETGVSANDISYVEMHGTGTQAGDAGETTSVLETLSPLTQHGLSVRPTSHPLHIGAAKANVGHGEAAAGATSLAKVLLMLKHSQIPPHIGIKTKLNHRLPDIRARNTYIPKTAQAWLRPAGGKRRVLLNNFSAAGGNTALVLEDAPPPKTSPVSDPRRHHVVTISAKTPESLVINLRNLMTWTESQSFEDSLLLPRLSYTTTARRTHHRHRAAVSGSDIAQIRSRLRAQLDQRINGGKSIPHPPKGPSFIFGFTGQGCPHPGMGADLYMRYASFRADIVRYDQMCTQMQLPSIQCLFEGDAAFASATPAALQLSHLCFQMALFRLWASFGIHPKAVVGHSLGEYAALYAAGALSQADAIYLVGRRAQLMENCLTLGTHAMLVVRASESAIIAALPGQVGTDYEIACRNGAQRLVIGGTIAQMAAARLVLEEKAMRCDFLDTPMAFHTTQVEPILESFLKTVVGCPIRTPSIPIISPTYGKVLRQATDFKPDYFVQHCREPVNMTDALVAAHGEGLIDASVLGIEIGPAPVVTHLIKEVVGPSMQYFSSISRGKDTWELLSKTMSEIYTAGASVNWSQYHEDFPASQQVLELPAYGWNLKDYWLQYVHDWSLRKGEPPLIVSSPTLESSSVHKVVIDTLHGGTDGEVVVEADLNREDLHPMVQGHRVYGVPLCTPSVYADIAFTIGEHIKKINAASLSAQAVTEVAEMQIQSALVANDNGQAQTLRTTVKFDVKKLSALCTFSTISAHDTKVAEQHASCRIRFVDLEISQGPHLKSQYAIKARMDTLKIQVGQSPGTYRFSKAMIYKMVGKLADFDEKYRGLCAITLDNDAMEAIGTVSFKGIPDNGKFHTSPAYLDALSQLGGFVMNANEGVDLDKEVFVNHGWQSLRFFEKLRPEMTYDTHVKMREGKDKLWSGDVTIFDADRNLIGVVEGVQLQGVPKRLMQYIITAANKKVSNPREERTKGTAATQTPPSRPREAAVVVETTKTIKTVAINTAEPDLITSTMAILSEEMGMTIDQLTDDINFADAGLDSLLSLVISSRMRDQLGLEFDSMQFMEMSSVGGLKSFLKSLEPPADKAVLIDPEQIGVDELFATAQSVAIDVPQEAESNWFNALKILSEESGLANTDLTDDVVLADVGMDSLMSLVICSRLRDELDVDFADRTMFEDCETVLDLRKRFSTPTDSSDSNSDSQPSTPSERSSSSKSSTANPTPLTDLDDLEELFGAQQHKREEVIKRQPIAPAWSLYLQGSQKRSDKILFLFPDGCGAATSYLGLPNVGSSTAIVAFNSPFMKKPTEMASYSLRDVIGSYVAGVRGRQAHGPYHLGGWSAGGILAYAIAQELIAAGEDVHDLLLIDSPAPNKGLDRLPDRFFDHCTDVGLFGTEMQRGSDAAKPPEWLMPHFRASIELLHDYHAPPMAPMQAQTLKVTIVWAGGCAFDGATYGHLPPASTDTDEDTEGMQFLTEQRTDFGPGAWANLFPSADLKMRVVEGAHHFSMMRDHGAEKLVAFVREALEPVPYS